MRCGEILALKEGGRILLTFEDGGCRLYPCRRKAGFFGAAEHSRLKNRFKFCINGKDFSYPALQISTFVVFL
jgi:hypothetical protein